MNLAIRNFKEELISTFNEAQLPIEVKRLVLQELMIEVSRVADVQVNNEKQEIENSNSNND